MRNKRLFFISLFLILSSLIFTGCKSNHLQLSSNEKSYKKEVYAEYKEHATKLLSQSLNSKYEQEVSITSIKIISNFDYSLRRSTEPYKKIATGKAKIGNEEFDVYLKWNIDGNSDKFICYDNMEKDKILHDLEEYFTKLYGQKPYATRYEVFSSLGYEYKVVDGMIQDKYNGNIEDYLNKFKDSISIIVAYEDLETVIFENTLNELGSVIDKTPKELLNGKNIYIINSFKDNLSSISLKSILNNANDINKFLPLIKEYIHYERGLTKKWTNNMIEFAEFTYKGNITDKSILVDNDCNLNLEKWKHLPISRFSNCEVVSDWYYAPDKNSVFYIREDFLTTQNSKYIVLFCNKNSKDNMNYSFDVIPSHESGYLMIDTKNENTWFVVCIQEDNTSKVSRKIQDYLKNISFNLIFSEKLLTFE